jgi:hypothetical protein
MAPSLALVHSVHHTLSPAGWAIGLVIILALAMFMRRTSSRRNGARWQPPSAQTPWQSSQWSGEDEHSYQNRDVAPPARQAMGLTPYHDPSRDHLRPPD